MNEKKYKGKIGWADGNILNTRSGHYVFIRSCKNSKCKVNTFTSIENYYAQISSTKIKKVKEGKIYAIPKTDLNLKRFSGIDKRVISNVDIKDIKIKKKVKLKRRHNFYIYKYMK